MNYEIVDFDEALPLKIFRAKFNNSPPHWHDEFEIIQVLQGDIKITVSSDTYIFNKGDMALINFKDIHQIQSLESESLLQIIQINAKFMDTHFPYITDMKFKCNGLKDSNDINSINLLALKKLIGYIIGILIEKKEGYKYEVISSLYKLFGMLENTLPYKIEVEGAINENNSNFQRLSKIIEYIEQNFINEININTLADMLHLNKYYLSHFFKDHTGLSIGQYITNLRMEKAKELLINTDDSITNIVLLCGFKNVKYFYKVFKEAYKCSPAEYKNSNKKDKNSKKVHEIDLYKGYTYYTDKFESTAESKKTKIEILSLPVGYLKEDKHVRNITVDIKSVKGKHNKYGSLCVGAGRAAEVLRKNFDSQLDTLSRECGFKYLRFHSVFHDEMNVYYEDSQGNPIYNWQYVDMVYDALLEKGMKPFVELSFMPEALASGTKTVAWWKGNVTPPKDYDKWYELIKNFVTHVEERYGREEILTWYFEVWNEPNHGTFFNKDMQEYFKMYDYAAKAIKDVCPNYRVGGPASVGNRWIKELISHCSTTKKPIDFISAHKYGAKGDFDEFGKKYLRLRDKDEIINGVKGIKQNVMESSMPDLEVHITEWSLSHLPRDPVHDSYVSAPYILHSLKKLEGTVNSMSYWTFTDIFEEVGPPPSPFHGGFGLMNTQSLKKAAYFAYKFIHELGEYELNNEDAESWVCRENNEIQALFWNLTISKQDTYNEKYYNKELIADTIAPVNFAIKGLLKGEYSLELYRIGYESNDVQTEYIKMGSPNNLSLENVKILNEHNCGKPILTQQVKIDEGQEISYNVPMRENDVCFIKLKMISKTDI